MALLKALMDIRIWVAASMAVAFLVGPIGDIASTLVIAVLMMQMVAAMEGLSFHGDDFRRDAGPIMYCFLACFGVSTGATLLMGSLFIGDESLWYGWCMLASVPTGVSVIALTLMMHGNRVLSVLALTVVYLLALGVTPLLTTMLIGDAVSPFEILMYVVLFIAVPIAATVPLKRFRINGDCKVIFINAMMFLLLIFAVGNNRDFIFENILMVAAIAGACLLRTFGVSIAVLYAMKRMSGNRGNAVAYMGFAVWKNSGLATSLCLALLSAQYPEAALPCAVSLMVENVWYAAMNSLIKKVWPPGTTIQEEILGPGGART
ncbi:Na+-dependent transporter [Methanomassiliicoccaceae archaeon COG_1]|nr:Na+-dependent transporter [Methanomassiliicoccaceae archaeon COG_1]